MKIIEVPQPLKLTLQDRAGNDLEEEVTFTTFLSNAIDFYSEGVKTIKQLHQVQSIVDAVEKATDTITLEDAEYELLKSAIDVYPSKLMPKVGRQYLPFFDAFDKIQSVKK
jgi:hypothetical protein